MLATLCLAAVAISPKIEVEHDPIKDHTTTTLKLGNIVKDFQGTLEVELHCHTDGTIRPAISPTKSISVHFIGHSENWVYLKYRDIVIMSGSQTYKLGEPSHDGDVGNGYVLEQFTAYLTLKDVEQMGGASVVRGKVGVHEFSLTSEQQRLIKEYAALLKVDEATATRQERERNAPILTDWRVARKDAEEAARRGSKNLRQKNYDRAIGKSVAAICERYKITAEQLQEIVTEK